MNAFKDVKELRVFRGDLYAGNLRRTNQGCELEFASAFLTDPTYNTLTYKIRKHSRPYRHLGVNLPPFFAGLLPEGLRLKALVRELKTSEDDLFSLLAAAGERAIGDIYTVTEGIERPVPEIPLVKEIDFYEFFDKILKQGVASRDEESLSGVQEKISASMISFPVHTAKKNRSYILKLNPKDKDKDNLIYNEYQSLMLAKKCGLEVNKAKIVYDKNKNPGLLIERFDRVATEDGEIKKVHQEDACQFLGRYPADKYRISFKEICSGIQELATAPTIEIMKAIQLYVFSYLLGNGDMHAKNISLQTDWMTGRVQLTPAYDLICTYLYKDRSMAIKLDGRDANFKLKHFIDFATRFGLQKRAIDHALEKLIVRFNKHRHLLFDIPALKEKDINLLKKMFQERTL